MTDRKDPEIPDTESTTKTGATHSDGRAGFSFQNYRVIQRLGEGGMGEVWEAEQLEPIRRRVALKVIKLGMDTREIVARFESERQALALMNHPNIARVFDAGSTPEGRPFFAMELVRGAPITKYCDSNKLAMRDRLKLMIPVIGAIQHAHQKGVIHRDLKPSNILVAVQDGKPVPKVIDFGVAKAIDHRLTEQTVFTRQGQLIGTPEFMSPEQAEMSELDIDTRTDVYSLGIVLYQLLTGTLPFDLEQLRVAGFGEIQRIIRETEPLRPSTRLTALGGQQEVVARKRGTDPGTLRKQLRGDLDWIVMKALEKDRTRRYETANGLSKDLERHLRHEPVYAGPPSTAYRARKFVRRHTIGVVATALVTMALVFGIVGTTFGMLRAKRAEQRANQEAATAKQVSEFLVDIFGVADPREARGATITARELLDQGAVRIDSLADQPLVQARLMNTMARVYINLGLHEQARPLLERALEIRREIHGEVHEEVAQSAYDLGIVRWRSGDIEAARESWERALQVRQTVFGPVHPRVADSLASLAVYELQTGDYPAARRLYEEALANHQEAVGKEDEFVANSYYALGLLAFNSGDLAEARQRFERSLKIRREILPPDHPHFASSANMLGNVLMQAGDYDQAEIWLTEALRLNEKVLGPESSETAYALTALGTLRFNQGNYADSEALNRRALTIREQTLGPDHFEIGYSLNRLGIVLDYVGRADEARPLFERSLSILEAAFGPDHTEVGYVLTNLGSALSHLGHYDSARALHQRALALHERNLGPEHPELAWALNGAADLFEATDEYERALPLLERSRSIREDSLGPEHPALAYTSRRLGMLLTKMGEYKPAEQLLVRALQIEESKLGNPHPETAHTRAALADLYEAWEKPDKAAEYRTQAQSD